MMDGNVSCRDYEFPYQPYDIQIQLMDKIYESIDSGKVSIIESPTGTGKSLSIICSVLKWIADYKAARVADLSAEIEKLKLSCKPDSKENDWVFQQSRQISVNREIHSINQHLTAINKHFDYSKELRKKAKFRKFSAEDSSMIGSSKRPADNDELLGLLDDENELIVKYCEEDLLETINDDKKYENYYKPKIYYCSRTHSQLSQFINEIKKTKKSHISSCDTTSMMMVPLSSRVNYCINPNVNRFSSVHIINEKCNELQSGKQKCSMYKHGRMNQLNEDILASVQDLEDIVSKGKQLNACPYYASRLSISEAEIVILPYNILLHKGTRESFGVHLKDSVVIVDEAHNLLETLSGVYSIEIRHRQLEILQSLLAKYMARYYSRFNSLNIMYLKQLIFVLKKLMLSMKASSKSTHSFDPLDFVLQLQIEHINIYKLVDFMDKSHIASKLHMFSVKPQNNDEVKKAKIGAPKRF